MQRLAGVLCAQEMPARRRGAGKAGLCAPCGGWHACIVAASPSVLNSHPAPLPDSDKPYTRPSSAGQRPPACPAPRRPSQSSSSRRQRWRWMPARSASWMERRSSRRQAAVMASQQPRRRRRKERAQPRREKPRQQRQPLQSPCRSATRLLPPARTLKRTSTASLASCASTRT